MTFRIPLVAALAFSFAITATGRFAFAQQPGNVGNIGAPTAPQPATVEELPSGQTSDQGQPLEHYWQGPSDSGFVPNEYYPGGHGEGCAPEGCCEQGYCTPSCGACATGCGETSCDSGGGWFGLGGGQFYFTADYLHVRSSFSEAVAFVEEDLANGDDEFVPLEFDYESSYRFGGGYRSCCCGQEIRFLFTRMTSEASDTAFPGDVVPYEAAPPPGGQTNINADVDALSFDLECAKTIPLGGQCCETPCGDGCQNACGCGESCCPKPCPAWDITWSGGIRIADVDWNRSYVAVDANDFPVTDAQVEMEFQGAGLRVGLEGRRYFFKDGWLSVYSKGNISLLLGDVELKSTRAVDDPTTALSPDAINTQTFETTQIIPVTEIEAGATAQVTCHTAFTAGYLLAAWHDLGFRDEHDLNTLLPLRYDDANILGFDGFFARVEVGY